MFKSVFLNKFTFILATWAISSIAFISISDVRTHVGARNLTKDLLQKYQKIIFLYKKDYDVYPTNLQNIYFFARSKGIELSRHDFYGQRLEYVPLTESQFVIRSFGIEDQFARKKGIHKNLFRSAKGWATLFRTTAPTPIRLPHFYQPAFLMSIASYDRKYIAKIFTHSATQKNTLVIVNNSKEKDVVYINHIDQPEQMLWIPGTSSLAFTSDPNKGRNESLQLIDVKTLEHRFIRLSDNLRGLSHLQSEEREAFSASIAGFNKNTLFFFATDDLQSPIAFDRLFSGSHLYKIEVSDDNDLKVQRLESELAIHPLHSAPEKPLYDKGNALQQKWFSTFPNGEINTTITAWQDLAIASKETPTFPYTLLYLISLYEKASEIIDPESQGPQIESMKAIAMEYASTLKETETAPQWMKLTAAHAWKQLLEDKNTTISLAGELYP